MCCADMLLLSRDAMMTQSGRTDGIFAISAITGEGLEPLLAEITEQTKDPRSSEVLTLGFDAGRTRAWLFDAGVVTSETQTENGYRLEVFWSAIQKERFQRLE